ncbi:D-alanyl-D-alanine carboxypeptidase family protein [Tepidimonas alkaliphilus]|nr:serine hydrolase [Tepidimonas alkaliphilus]
MAVLLALTLSGPWAADSAQAAPRDGKSKSEVAAREKKKSPPVAKAARSVAPRSKAAVQPASRRARARAPARAGTPTAAPRPKAEVGSAVGPRRIAAVSVTGGAAAWAPLASAADEGLDGLRLHSSAALVLDADTNAVLFHKNDEAVLPIASLTKLMTALVVVDAGLPLDEVLTITDDDVDRIKGSGSRLAVGTQLTRAEALHLALMASENRAAHALGRTYPGGVAALVAAMNNKAHELGLRQTRFVEPTGLSPDNRSSPRDLARLVQVASTRPLLRELSVSPRYELDDGRRVVHYRNSNKLVRESDWDILLQKTGYIREAGRCVAMQVRLAGRNVIMVLMNAGNSTARWADAENLLHWLQRSLVGGGASPAGPRT